MQNNKNNVQLENDHECCKAPKCKTLNEKV